MHLCRTTPVSHRAQERGCGHALPRMRRLLAGHCAASITAVISSLGCVDGCFNQSPPMYFRRCRRETAGAKKKLSGPTMSNHLPTALTSEADETKNRQLFCFIHSTYLLCIATDCQQS